MAYEGSLTEIPFPEVLQQIARTAGTGILTLQGSDEIIGVTFLKGEVVSVDAVNQAPEDGLGAVLEEDGLLSREDFSGLVAENRAGGGRVIDLLVERGYIHRQQLLDALRRQTLRLCAEACGWEGGLFRFYRGDQVSYEHGIEPINVDDLLASLAGAGDGAARSPAPSKPPAQPAVEPPFEPEAEAPTWPLPPEGPSPVDELAPAEEVPEVEVLKLEPLTPEPSAAEPLPVEMPDVDYWAEDDELDAPRPRRMPRLDLNIDWAAISAPVMPGRLLGVAMLTCLAALMFLAPERLLVPLEGQERIRSALAEEIESSAFAKVDQAAKTFFLLHGGFPENLRELIALNLLGPGEDRLVDGRRLAYTEAPVSYLLAVEGGARLDTAIRTETISGNFLLDPEFSPPELLDTPPLVLLD